MPAENAGRAFALVLVDQFARLGVRHAVLAPGSRSTPIALALLEHPEIDVHVRIDERSAAYLALGIAKASGQVVPVLCTSGTATTYFHGAVMEADLARVPLLVLTADRPPELHGIGANQTVEQSGLYGSAVRLSVDVPAPESSAAATKEWRELAFRAVVACTGGQGVAAGPVHLNLALREPLVPVDDGIGFPHDLGLDGRRVTVSRARSDSGAVAALTARLGGVHNAVVVVGDVAGDPDAAVRWCEEAGWPLIAEPHSNARRGPCALRAVDALLRDADFVAGHRPDLVLVLGRIGLSRAVPDWLRTVPHVVMSPDGANWDTTRAALEVITASADTLDRLEPATYRADPSWLAEWRAASARAGAAVDRLLDGGDLNEPLIAREVARLAASGSALVVASSMPIRDLDVVMEPRSDITVFANRGVSGIDGFVSTALGVAIARPNAPTIALCGDLSLLHDSNGLLIGGERAPDVTFVVVNNDGGGIFSLLPQAGAVAPAAFERLFGTPHGVAIETLVAAYGMDHDLAATRAELADALARRGGVHVVEIRTRRADNAVLHDRMREVTSG
ncbi:MAG TPA: 2-succinyl-5-enolpyruvyl-6-hydroxy-3-cyclohexene-1-carboxylic-acid synthase [Mycobacteriales bacterium]|jgi:2-succinyl-5-enolpyruvyl-6-hydroxy-3-cyclohexene-1-carboxylate synthase|nr:2-succinyl-5-enolpyruvyl-6-hydroxy-3-cyclohexene-1-carboxylic-acid synthase [Mycobacteriales bacterium]HVX69909.1 2-succinyl-5-enolpyruvyl-6-hydroxy-3-cyclohexene-1-carboxylic-acid synthase [Mycobacteriales bacterium]